MSSAPIAINTGKLDPKDLVGRRSVIDLCWTRLEGGSSLLLTGERRIGKSSVAQHLAYQPRTGWIVVYIDVEAIDSVEKLIRAIVNAVSKAEALPRKLRNGVVSLLDRIDGASLLGAEINLKDRVTRESYDVLDELILDELPILAKTLAENSSTKEALLLLRTLRALRSHHKNLRQLLCGSIGLHHLLANSSEITAAVNDLFTIPIGTLETPEAIELAQRLLLGIDRTVAIDDPLLRAIVEATDGIAFYEHHLVATLQLGGAITLDAVKAARKIGVGSSDDPWKTVHYVKRIEEYFGPDADLATAILDGVAKSGPKGLTVDEVLTSLSVSLGRSVNRQFVLNLIHRLRLDHYVDFDDTIEPNVLRFCFNVVRDAWIARRAR
jgi:hypothetical protein